MLLHFINKERHPSKIYILDEEVYKLAKNHHNYDVDEKGLPLLSTVPFIIDIY
jgi:hypothetical protein